MLRYLLEKEFKQFLRNALLPRIALMVPLMVMLVTPLVATMDVRDVRVALVDHDRTVASRRLADRVAASPYFTLVARPAAYAAALRLVEDDRADVVLTIPADYGRQLGAGREPPRVHIAANAVNAIKAQLGAGYLSQLVAAHTATPGADRLAVQYRYNPTLDYHAYMVPALMTLLLVVLCGVLPALNIVSEKEIGTIEQINVTPVGRLTFTLAKLIPFWVIGLVAVAVGVVVGGAVYAALYRRHVGLRARRVGLLVDAAPGAVRDLFLRDDFYSHGRTFHAHCVDAALGAGRDVRPADALLRRSDARALPKGRDGDRPAAPSGRAGTDGPGPWCVGRGQL